MGRVAAVCERVSVANPHQRPVGLQRQRGPVPFGGSELVSEAQALAARGFKVRTADTLMHSDAQKQSLAHWLIEPGA